ncbi:terminase TerL endonuclease subunit [Bradyrhizobium sp. 26S5]|uniref:terminase large subunit n=1 Tax=Bradyrhizobium sp. 26S5 TaxID=3139729 RepID=UPI0030D583FE
MGKPLKLAPFMREDFVAIYDNPAGTRRAIISRGRKNAKTTEAAVILLLHLCGPEAKPNSQLFSDAQSRDQAGILFNLAAKIIRLSPSLIDYCGIRESGKQIYCEELGTLYRALSADAPTAHGLSPALIVHDELGQVRGPRSELYEALETATAAQEDPLSVIISTQAPTDSDLLSILIDDAKAGHDKRTVLRFHAAPAELDTFSKEAIKAANPAFDLFMNKREVLAMAADAERMPSRQSEYENLVLNRRVEAASPFISRDLWKSCGGPVGEFDKKTPLYGGLDLSEVNDLTAFVLIGKIDGIWHVKPTFWLPGNGLAERAKKDRAPYDLWKDQGYLLAAPGNSIDYEYVAGWLRGEFDRYNIRTIAFDRWNMRHLKPWLAKAGFTEKFIDDHFKEFGQGTQSMSPALRELEADILNGRIAHGNHPVLSMCAANAVVDGKDASNRKLSKSRSAGRIDGMVALAMAKGAAPLDDIKPPRKYQLLFA